MMENNVLILVPRGSSNIGSDYNSVEMLYFTVESAVYFFPTLFSNRNRILKGNIALKVLRSGNDLPTLII